MGMVITIILIAKFTKMQMYFGRIISNTANFWDMSLARNALEKIQTINL